MESGDGDRLKTKESDRNREIVSDHDELEDGNNHLVLSEKSSY